MSLLRFCEWLAATPGSIALHESRYMFLIVLTVHVLTLCVLVGTAVMLDLRLLGLTLRRVPASEVMARLLPLTGPGIRNPRSSICSLVVDPGSECPFSSSVNGFNSLRCWSRCAALRGCFQSLRASILWD